ncbi:hypothetical protein LCGC14_1510570 [marine sediment metagenome]|uniref:Uncharacterized protein n=1 Tax=marine sediment metagenome TaxID=412755 RepID=A0A0F9M2P1_9ZZZZ
MTDNHTVVNNYGPNFNDSKLRREKLQLQKSRDLLNGEILTLENAHYHHIDYNINNDNHDNHVFISTKTHMKITSAQVRNPIVAEWYKIQLQENLRALKEGRKPRLKKVNKALNFNELKTQQHWSDKETTISSRIEKGLYEKIKKMNINKLIQNLIRSFLRFPKFRKDLLDKISYQFEQDFSGPILSEKWLEDTNVVTGIFSIVEKELLTFHFTFLSNFTVSYAIRVGLIHFRDLENQEPIDKEEVIPILNELIDN